MSQKTEDIWLKSFCGMCYMACGIRVHRVNGVVVGIEGDPNHPLNRGRMCAKGKAGVMSLYNSSRTISPYKRTNPEKGIGLDPGWVKISWNEAIATIVDRLKRIADEPQKLFVQGWETLGRSTVWLNSFASAFGTPNFQGAQSATCGKVIHCVERMVTGGFHQHPDFHYCNYAIYAGTQQGIAARAALVHLIKDVADARERGMKLVSIDPVGAYAAAKADEWIPIRPGTDAAWALATMNVLLNELGIYDAEFLKKRTNAPYLIGHNGRCVRDKETGKPLVWDPVDNRAKRYDDQSIKDFALEGAREVRGVPCKPAFQLLKEHVKSFPPEKVSEITTIRADTIRRIAREFGEAARIGSTIVIGGKELPYRPVAVDWAKAISGHKHGFHQGWVLKLLNILVGAINVPGGMMGTMTAAHGPRPWWPREGRDGLLEVGAYTGPLGEAGHSSFPGHEPVPPVRQDLFELFPIGSHATTVFPLVGLDPKKYGLSYGPEVVIHGPASYVLGAYGSTKVAAEFYKKIPFAVGFAIEINETHEFDDIVLPFPTYLERSDLGAGSFNLEPSGTDDWFWNVRQRVVDPPPDMRPLEEVMTEIADRLGILDSFNRILSHQLRLEEPYALEPEKKYSNDEVIDIFIKSWLGPEYDAKRIRDQGAIRFTRAVDEAYPGPFTNARIPIYLEHFIDWGERLKEVTDQLGLPWDVSDYVALPKWGPCESYLKRGEDGYDLTAVHYKLPFIYGAHGNENPWLNEVCERNPYAYGILINSDVAKKKEIREGDTIWVESTAGKVRGNAKLTECIHPEVIAIAGHFGHWAKTMPIARGKGVAFETLVPHDFEHLDMLTTSVDYCVRVKVYRA